MKQRHREAADWNRDETERADLATFQRDILPLIREVSLSRLAKATGLSLRYVSQIRRGEKVPHPRHWQAFKRAAVH